MREPLIHRLPQSRLTNDFLALRFVPADVLLENAVCLWISTLAGMRVRRYISLLALSRTEGSVQPGLLGEDVHQLKDIPKK